MNSRQLHINVHIRNSYLRKKEKELLSSPEVYKENSLFCGEKCDVEKDKKHPDRWRESYPCTTADRGPNMLIYKDHLLKVIYAFFISGDCHFLCSFKYCVLVISLAVTKLKTQVVPLVSITCIFGWCSYTCLFNKSTSHLTCYYVARVPRRCHLSR